MPDSPYEQRVKEIIAQQLGIEVDEIANDASFVSELGADSFDIVELIMSMEEEFDIEISDEDAEKIRVVQDVINFLDKQRNVA